MRIFIVPMFLLFELALFVMVLLARLRGKEIVWPEDPDGGEWDAVSNNYSFSALPVVFAIFDS